jgi:hypothetical protein
VPLRWPQVACCIHTKFNKDWYGRSSDIRVLSQKFEAAMLVLLMGGIYELRR